MKSQGQMRTAAASQRANREAARHRVMEHFKACTETADQVERDYAASPGKHLIVTALRHYAHVRPRVRTVSGRRGAPPWK